MGTQLTRPAGWARQFVSASDPVERLDALGQVEFDVKAAIRLQFDELADRFGIQTREVDRAMLTGMPVLLLHGWPYDTRTYVDVAPRL